MCLSCNRPLTYGGETGFSHDDAGAASTSTTAHESVMVATAPNMIEAEQYFSLESWIARSTLAGARLRPATL